MVAHDPRLIGIVDHVDVTEVLCVFNLMLTNDLDGLIDAIPGAVKRSALRRVPDPEVLLVLTAIHFDKWRAIATVEVQHEC